MTLEIETTETLLAVKGLIATPEEYIAFYPDYSEARASNGPIVEAYGPKSRTASQFSLVGAFEHVLERKLHQQEILFLCKNHTWTNSHSEIPGYSHMTMKEQTVAVRVKHHLHTMHLIDKMIRQANGKP